MNRKAVLMAAVDKRRRKANGEFAYNPNRIWGGDDDRYEEEDRRHARGEYRPEGVPMYPYRDIIADIGGMLMGNRIGFAVGGYSDGTRRHDDMRRRADDRRMMDGYPDSEYEREYDRRRSRTRAEYNGDRGVWMNHGDMGDRFDEHDRRNRGDMGRRDGFAMGCGRNDRMDEPLTREEAKEWVEHMENEDGTRGPHYSMEQVKNIMEKHDIKCDPLDFYVALNAMYSDYYKVAKKNGVDTTDFYAGLACAFLDDKDASPNKLAEYYRYIVK